MSSCPVGPLNARIKEGIVGNGVAVTVSTHITESPYSSCTHTFGYPTFRGSKRGIHYGRIRLPDAAGGPFPIVINFHGGFWKSEWSLERHGPSTAAPTRSSSGGGSCERHAVHSARCPPAEWPHR